MSTVGVDGADAEVIVVGAGHNALICAAYLAEAGIDVLVLEARDTVGGNTVTEELTLPGFRHDSCSSAHVIVQSNPLIRDQELPLARYGLRYAYPDPAIVMPFDDGESLTMYLDREATAEEFASHSSADALAYLRLLDDWDELKGVHAALQDQPADRAPVSGPAVERYRAQQAKSALQVVHERFEQPRSRAFIAWMAAATIQPLDRPGTGILPLSLTAGRARFGWTTPYGGSQALPDACVALIEDRGGRVVTDAEVARIERTDGRASAAVTADGRRFTAARAVVSSMHATRLPEVVGPDAFPPDYLDAVERWEPGLTLFAVHLALREAPRFRTHDGDSVAVGAGMGTTDGFLRQLEAFREGREDASDPWLLIVTSSVVDPSRVPEDGGATVKLLTIAPYQHRDGTVAWDERKQNYAQALIARFARNVVNYDPGDELAWRAESPLDLERANLHNVAGSCHGGDQLPSQAGANRPAPGWGDYRTPVAGLYQTGATTHPGGSVSGRPGRNAAREVLTDLGIDPRGLIRDA